MSTPGCAHRDGTWIECGAEPLSLVHRAGSHRYNRGVACARCQGTGEVERTIGGNGYAEQDVMCECMDCLGTGRLPEEEDET